MSKVFKSYREESKGNWGTTVEYGVNITTEQLQTGAILRIADATEKVASNYDAMREDRDRYKRWYEDQKDRNAKLWRSNNSLRGAITRFKKRLAAK